MASTIGPTTAETQDSRKQSFTGTIDQENRNEERTIGGSSDSSARNQVVSDIEDRTSLRPKNNVETGYLTKSPRAARNAEPPAGKAQAVVPPMSEMEREAMLERQRMSLLKQMTDYLSSDGTSRYTRDTFRRVFTEKEFLEKLFKLFDLDQKGVLHQEEWVDFLKLRLTGEKQIDFAEQLESVAYVLCSEDPIDLEKFIQIFKAKGVIEKVFRLIDNSSDGLVTQLQIMEFVAALSTARPRTGLDKQNLEWLEKIFRETVGDEKEIRREDFNKILLSKNPFFTDRVFEIFDKNNNGTISLEEFIDAMHQFAGKSIDDKIKFLFKVYDLDGDGLIQQRELEHVMRACMEENGMKFSQEQIEDLTIAMFEDADTNNRGTITFEALKNQLEKHGGLLENLTISIDRWLVPAKPKPQPSSFQSKIKALTPYQLTRPYMKNNYVFLIFVLSYSLLNAILFISRSIEYRDHNHYVIVARACGQLLNFNCMFVLVLMLRHCITFLRTRGFSVFLPLDQHIYLHKLTGVIIFILSVVHTIMHLLNFGVMVHTDPVANARNYTHSEGILADKPGTIAGDEDNPNEGVIVHTDPVVDAKNYTLAEWILTSRPGVYGYAATQPLQTYICLIITIINFSIMSHRVIVHTDPVVNARNYTLAEWILTSRPGLYGLVGGAANPTGVCLIIILSIMFICSQTFVRRGGSFEIFYWTHLLYVPFWILLIFHGPNFWKWVVVPGIIYIIERVVRLVWLRSERGKTYISSGLLLPSRVTHLVIKRPPHFDYCPGDYVFVNIPAIAKYEWHPFTISSAPEQEDYMWLHIRGVGEWTNRLYNYFDREQEKLHNAQDQLVAAQTGIQTKKPAPVVNGEVSLVVEKRPIKRLQATIQRTLSGKEKDRGMPRAVSFKRDPLVSGGVTNEAFESMEQIPPQTVSEGDISPLGRNRKLTPEKKLHMLLLSRKQPLEKSLSMPDMQTRVKKRERLLALREYARSESERSFDEVQMRKARLQALGLAYLSPQNKSLAQSFRYMRNKPTIIAFKTPSLENCEVQLQAIAAAAQAAGSPERRAEEGRLPAVVAAPSNKFPITPVNYPVAGKPLESFVGTKLTNTRSVKRHLSKEPRIVDLGRTDEIFIDGPYGAPSSHIFRAQHAILIATGIGVTPFASILQSVMHRYWKARHCCPQCKHSWASEIPPTIMNLRKVDFFWINRDQRSFEWFVNLLSQLEIEQAELGGAMERFLEMHMYITSALQKTDMKAVGLQLALDLLHEKEKRDLITGLKTRTNAGRPNWDKVFKQLLDQKKGKITVFYCGPPQLGKLLRFKCDQFGFNFRKEVF